MSSSKFKLIVVLLAIAIVGCASAEKRLEQGYDQQSRGRYEQAVNRYAQALEKDPGLDEARERLIEAGDLAIEERVNDAQFLAEEGDPVSSASHLRRVDAVVARARSVGVRLSVPEGYRTMRRHTFDDAFESLVDNAVTAREHGHWADCVDACRWARRDFEPSLEQKQRAFTEEAAALVEWSEEEYMNGYLRSSFDIASNVPSLAWSPAELSMRATEIMEDALIAGEVELIVLPVQAKAGTRTSGRNKRSRSAGIADQLDVALQQGPWRVPPPFVRLQDTTKVNQLLELAGLVDEEIRLTALALILHLAEADYAAYMRMVDIESTEFDVKSRTRNARTWDGEHVTFQEEQGQRRIQATAQVILIDAYGNELANVLTSGTGTARFARGVYDGNPKELNLDRNEVDLFDRIALERQDTELHEALVFDLSAGIADAVFETALAQVP